MADNKNMLLRANLKQLKLPAMVAEFEKLAREAAEANEGYEQYLLRLTELEVVARASNAVQTRIRAAGFPVAKDFDTFDFSAVPSLSKPKVLELARGDWIAQRTNTCFIGSPGTGKTHLAVALGLAACRQGKRVRRDVRTRCSRRPRCWFPRVQLSWHGREMRQRSGMTADRRGSGGTRRR